ncbi:MAG: TRAP transporter large permease subunit, partial [Pseudomonadota bacterium]|nr:TRAP transporter large permease subunit [Pseudomonadota bacterium]
MGLLAHLFNTSPRRRPQGWLAWPMTLYCAAVAAWVLSAATWMRVDSLAMTIIFLSLILVPSFLLVAATPRSNPTTPSLLDWVLAGAAAASAIYFILNIPDTAERISLLSPLSWDQFLFAAILILLTLEITRRTVGLFLMLLVIAFIVYNRYGHMIDGPMGHGYISFRHFVDINVYTSDGLFGTPVRVAATYAFLFVLFGTVLERAKGGDFFFGLSAALTGKSPGGPAKVAVVSSALFGTMSGSPTSDVVATGSITIPMMKKLGYKPEMAAGTEVAASTGGSL